MKIILLALTLFFGSVGSAQGSWKVVLNGKNSLSTSTESEEKNVISVKAKDLSKKNDFTILYTEKEKNAAWQRSIIAVDDKDQELLNKQTDKLKIKNSELLQLFKKSNKIRFYTISLPKDPAKRAVVRVRRVHLCTLILKT
jgi:hypothetical protein